MNACMNSFFFSYLFIEYLSKTLDNMGQKISKTTLDKKDLEMLSKTSNKSEEEVLFWYEHFNKECPSGKLGVEQFIKYYKSFRKDENVEDLAKHCFNAFDLDQNSYIDFGEFLIAYVATTNTGPYDRDPYEKLKYAFSVYDKNNDKVLNQNEIRLVLQSMFKLLNVDESAVSIETCMDNIMASLDINHDKLISVDEFIHGIINDEFLQSLLSPFPLNQ
jgi:Ca2+-binding EF-hand superfamily protein